MPDEATCYIAIGSNLGDRTANIRAAIDRLRATEQVAVTRVSSQLENPAVGGPDGSPPFLNAAIEVRTCLAPRLLLQHLLDIERALGRSRSVRNAPRTIDLDLLLYDELIIRSNELTLPHPRMHERRFVLAPLAEIAAEVVHPVLHRSVASLLAAL